MSDDFDNNHRGDREFLVWLKYGGIDELFEYLEEPRKDWKRIAVCREIERRDNVKD